MVLKGPHISLPPLHPIRRTLKPQPCAHYDGIGVDFVHGADLLAFLSLIALVNADCVDPDVGPVDVVIKGCCGFQEIVQAGPEVLADGEWMVVEVDFLGSGGEAPDVEDGGVGGNFGDWVCFDGEC